ncbi:hypothetical protein MNBD_GAMMA12-3518 [hydrothermal vent metagenome]|uniref:Cysteine-rich CWC n=1 Tax=hydrothermal vent metagenome TaxID=652676 RepID=A0A3B0YCT7_9ZZZZ
MNKKKCSICSTEFTCGARVNEARCWCAQLPMIMPAEFEQDCRCKDCLISTISQKIETAIINISHEEILTLASQYSSQKALVENIDYTIEEGRYVFSVWYHLKRGDCCGNGCRNCPYNHREVKA